MKKCHMKKGLSMFQKHIRDMSLETRNIWKSQRIQNFQLGNKNDRPAGTKILRKFLSKAATIQANVSRVKLPNE